MHCSLKKLCLPHKYWYHEKVISVSVTTHTFSSMLARERVLV
jgi:hypothetical protein